MHHSIRQFVSDQNGQALVAAALCMVIVISFLGLVVDLGHLKLAKRNLQNAADAAALAAALEIRICGDTPNCAAMRAAAQKSMEENGYTGANIQVNCAPDAGTQLTLTVNQPACSMGASDPNNGNVRVAEVVLAQTVRTYFSRIVGFNSVRIRVRAEAKRLQNGPCIYALDPTGAAAVNLTLLAGLVSTCGIVDESNSPAAFACLASASLSAKSISITGGVAQLLCLTRPTPRTGVPVPDPPDPLAYLPKPNLLPCGTSTRSPYHGSSQPVNLPLGATAVFYPDAAYCGGINISLLSTATFQPGTYVLRSTTDFLGRSYGGLTISLLNNVVGNGVTFYNYGPKGSIAFVLPNLLGVLGTTQLTAPTNGTYGGILFFQDPGNTDPASLTLASSGTSKLEGAYYFPAASVDVALSGPAAYNYLVAKRVNITILTALVAQTTRFNNDYSSLSNTVPLGGDGVALVQ